MKKRYYSICVILWVLITTLSATSPTTNVNLIEFPKRTTLYVITVNLNNSSATKQLFYTLNGRLVQTRDVSYINPTLSPGIFNF